jgi:N-acetyl-gamma-glutamylphosphate reductase
MPQSTPDWQPLSMLPVMANLVSGMLAEVQTQLQSLHAAQAQRYVPDASMVDQVIEAYSEQQDFLWVYESQLDRWQQELLTVEQRQQTEQMVVQLTELKRSLSEILAIADQFKGETV